MVYPIEITLAAKTDVDETYQWLRRRSARRAAKWMAGLQQAIQSLENNPERCGLAPESDVFEEEIRQLLYGKRPNVYRILFVIRNSVVTVLHVRHAARPFLEP